VANILALSQFLELLYRPTFKKLSDFINWHLSSSCEAEGIEFSRSRPSKKAAWQRL